MVSHFFHDLSTLVYGEEADDPSCLDDDPIVRVIYEHPYKALGLTPAQTAPWEVRDAFRLNALRLLAPTYFNKMDKALLPYKHALIAWHLLSGTLGTSVKAQDLRRHLHDKNGGHARYFAGEARDVLHVLRPVRSAGLRPTNPAVRACAWLTVMFVEALFALPDGTRDLVVPHQTYAFRVVYCGRTHVIQKRYSDFLELHEALASELLMVPGFPEKSIVFKIGGGDWRARGEALAQYAERVHASLAARGVFSPRLVRFLAVDAARVHVEEDGRFSKLLDSTGSQQGSAWHMVEETWLKRWRKFVLSRGARRYEPPGPITNELLLYPRDPKQPPGHDADLAEQDRARDEQRLKHAGDPHGSNGRGAASAAAPPPRDADGDVASSGGPPGQDGDAAAAKNHKADDASLVSGPLVVRRRVARFHPAPAREIRALAAKENRHVFVPPAATSVVDFYGPRPAEKPPPGAAAASSARGGKASSSSDAALAAETTTTPGTTTTTARDGGGDDALSLAAAPPPGPEAVAIGRHYRAVNYNLWTYWKLVHGGGPCISRKSKEIGSAPACGTGKEAVSRLQRFGRVCVAKNRRLAKYWHHLSKTAPGVREILVEYEEERLKKRAQDAIEASRLERTKSRLRDAARFTQRSWRAKKAYAFNDDNVRVQKHAQEVFATADGEVEHAAPGAPFVVEEGEPVVRTGHVERFDVKLTDADGPTLPFTLKKHACSEVTFVQTVNYARLGVDAPEDRAKRRLRQTATTTTTSTHPLPGGGESPASFGASTSSPAFSAAGATPTLAQQMMGPPGQQQQQYQGPPLSATLRKQREQLVPDAVLVVIQNYPVSSLTHKQAMGRLTAAKWPLVLRFEKPLSRTDVAPFVDLCREERAHLLAGGAAAAERAPLRDDLKLQHMKRLLHMGIPGLVKYGRQGRAHETVLYINETMVFWRVKGADKAKNETEYLSLKYDLTRGLALYDLKYVRIDKVSPVFQSLVASSAEPERCFSLFAEGRTLDLEVAYVAEDVADGRETRHEDPGLLRAARRLLAWAFDHVIKEARGSKIFVDKTGAPIRRTQPKKRLRMVR